MGGSQLCDLLNRDKSLRQFESRQRPFSSPPARFCQQPSAGESHRRDGRDPEEAERQAPDPEPSKFRHDAKAADLRINAKCDTPARLHHASANAILLQEP